MFWSNISWESGTLSRSFPTPSNPPCEMIAAGSEDVEAKSDPDRALVAAAPALGFAIPFDESEFTRLPWRSELLRSFDAVLSEPALTVELPYDPVCISRVPIALASCEN